MSESTVQFVDGLVRRVPRLEPLLREHLADNFGEVLPHVFFGDLTRLLLNEFTQDPHAKPLRAVLDERDAAFAGGDPEVTELIAVSFLQNLPERDRPGGGIRALLGPAMSAEVKRMDARPSP